MKRLTHKYRRGTAAYASIDEIVDRLYYYEETGLSPEEVMELKKQSEETIVESLDFERLTWRNMDGTSFFTEASQENLIDRLAAYENTCLKPEEIQRLKLHQWREHRWNNNLSEAPIGKLLQVRIKELEWISDYANDKVPDDEKRYHSPRTFTTVGVKRENGDWDYADNNGDEMILCDASESESTERNLGVFEEVVLEWREI